MSDPFELFHRWCAERPPGLEEDESGLRVPIPARPSLRLTSEGAESGTVKTPFLGARAVHVRYASVRRRYQIAAQLSLETASGEHPLTRLPFVVLDRDGCVMHPSHVRWIAEAVAARAEAATGRTVPVNPPVSDEAPVQPPEVGELEALVPDASAVGRLGPDGRRTWGIRVPEYRWLLGMIGAPFVLAIALPVFFVLGVLVGAIADSGGVVAALTLGPSALLAVLWTLPFLWLTFRQTTNHADPDGVHLGGVFTRTLRWADVKGLTLEGRVSGPVRLVANGEEVLAHWAQPGWASRPRIVDVVAFSESLAALGGVPLERSLPDVTAWRERADDRRAARAQARFWSELNATLRFADLQATEPIQPDDTTFDANELVVSLWQMNYLFLGGVVTNASKWGATVLRADPHGVTVGSERIPWSDIEEVRLEFRTQQGRESATVHTEGRFEVRKGARQRALGPWVQLHIDDQELQPVGEMIWIRDTLRGLHQQYARRDVAALGDASEIPNALKQLAEKVEIPS